MPETALAREVRLVHAAMRRDFDAARRLVGESPPCCIDCALGAADPALRDRMKRRRAWLVVLEEKLAARTAAQA